MNFKRTIILGIAFLISTLTYAQEQEKKIEENPKWDIGLEGMLGFAVGKDFYAFNVGGPSLMLRLNNNWKLGVGALPSFYIKNGKTGAKLGVAPRIDYKNFALIAPFFHFDSTDEWVWSIGLGYRFHRKDKAK
ncbi:hypothetical protein PBAC_33480 [Pedobacter glucosidilyticus]|jgi:hypothetical protein|uniref:Outer membrane protein beta-barrel domain-containing protein n=1 Tax=Pedobacter aquae TaxID=2605747 RepID=A0A5C0VGQ8_9SPHI|nr:MULTISPECIES: hypothetical protein [Pedobacter]KHJ36488.1 hypothetical protein PBAC_33480 [Pedobacter glucosidilyticus]QEK50572.1 hypothetical protein FYC62_01990 [Pedobacter aquae]QEK50791.1 hypothetical protein FYC62_03235 [Pedobacter aquae]